MGYELLGGLIGAGGRVGLIKNSFARGSILGFGEYAGGLVGFSDEIKITNSFSNVDITSTDISTGGLVGGKETASIIENSFASGAISGSGSASFGISGENGDNLSNVYWFDSGAGAVACYPFGGINCNNNGAPSSETDFYNPNHGVYVDGAENWDFDYVWQSHSNDFPSLRSLSEIDIGLIGEGSEEDPFL